MTRTLSKLAADNLTLSRDAAKRRLSQLYRPPLLALTSRFTDARRSVCGQNNLFQKHC